MPCSNSEARAASRKRPWWYNGTATVTSGSALTALSIEAALEGAVLPEETQMDSETSSGRNLQPAIALLYPPHLPQPRRAQPGLRLLGFVDAKDSEQFG